MVVAREGEGPSYTKAFTKFKPWSLYIKNISYICNSNLIYYIFNKLII